jgi:hypothetical protein
MSAALAAEDGDGPDGGGEAVEGLGVLGAGAAAAGATWRALDFAGFVEPLVASALPALGATGVTGAAAFVAVIAGVLLPPREASSTTATISPTAANPAATRPTISPVFVLGACGIDTGYGA